MDALENEGYSFKPLVFTEVGDGFEGPVSRRPERRSGHRIVCDDANLYSFGGYLKTESFGSVQHRLLEELWCFNFAEGRWKLLPTTGEAPKELASHCAALYGNYLHIFGGTGVSFGESTSNKLTRCDLRSLKWEEVPATGDDPEPQYGQSLVLDEERRQLYVVGGTTGFEFTMDVHRFDLTTKTWKLVYAYKGEPTDPLPRYRHEIAYDGANIYVFGGGTNVIAYELDTVPVFNIDTNQWSKLETKSAILSNTPSPPPVPPTDNDDGGGDQPAEEEPGREEGFPKPRKCHASVQLEDDVFICGGCNDTEVYDDIWKFHIPTSTWQLIPEKIPIPLAFHTACVTPEGCMYVFGGVTDIERSIRTNKTFKMWLKIPKLKELCWEAVLHSSKRIRTTACEKLVEMGIPSDFAKRAHPSPPGGKPNQDVESVWESDHLKTQNASCSLQ